MAARWADQPSIFDWDPKLPDDWDHSIRLMFSSEDSLWYNPPTAREISAGADLTKFLVERKQRKP